MRASGSSCVSRVRRGRPGDEGPLLRLWARAFDVPDMPAIWALDPRRHPRTLVIEGESGHVAAALYLLPREVNGPDGESVRLIGLANVAVDPDWRGQGLVHALLRGVDDEVEAGGYAGSALFTSTPGVYARDGWRTFPLEYLTARVPDGAGCEPGEGLVRPGSWLEWPALDPLHRRFARGHRFVTLRDDLDWRRSVLWLRDARVDVLLGSGGAPSGYLAWRTRPPAQNDSTRVPTLQLVDAGGDPEDPSWLIRLFAEGLRAAGEGGATLEVRLPPCPALAGALAAHGLVAVAQRDETGMVKPHLGGRDDLVALVAMPGAHHYLGDYY